MEDRTVSISAIGKAIRYLTDDRKLALTDNNDEAYDKLADGQYAAAALNIVDGVKHYVDQGIPNNQYNYDAETGESDYYKPRHSFTFLEILLSILVPGLVAFLYINSVKKQYSMEAEKNNSINYARVYRSSSAFAFAVNMDEMISHNVTTRIIPKSSGSNSSGDSGRSTTHTSSGGTVHSSGGGNRHF